MVKLKPKRNISFRGSEELYKRLKEIAGKDKRKVSAICEGLLWQGIVVRERTKDIIIN